MPPYHVIIPPEVSRAVRDYGLSREGVLPTLQHLQRLTIYGIGYRSFTEQYFDSCCRASILTPRRIGAHATPTC